MAGEVPLWRLKDHQRQMLVHPLSKYALATSVSLTPNRKGALERLLESSGVPDVEVFGQEDLNRLLAEHPGMELRHPNLWLTSTPVLQCVLASAFFGQSDLMKERAKRRLQVYVMNPSFDAARQMLEANRVCVIAGEQGVGKTCLAEVLVATYVEQGYEAYEVTGDVAEVYKALDTKRPQVFLYDDFLGMTALEDKLNKNEESRLVSLVEAIKKSKSSRLILTTREYILRQAKFTYEKLDRAQLDLLKFVVEVSHLNRLSRAEVLYRHLCFSDLPQEAITELVRSRAYLKVVDHPNYNPRLIETMCEASRHPNMLPSDFPRLFLAALDNPQTVWRHPFERHLPQSARDLVLAVCSFPRNVLLSDLIEASAAFAAGRPDAVVGRSERLQAEEQLRIIEGTFLFLSATVTSPVVGVMKPSVRDFVEAWFDERDAECENLLISAVRFEQVEWAIQQALAQNRSGFKRAIERNPEALLHALERTFFAPSCTAYATHQGIADVHVRRSSARLETFLRGATLLPKEDAAQSLMRLLDKLEAAGYPSGEYASTVLDLAGKLLDLGMAAHNHYVALLRRHLVQLAEEASDIDEVETLYEFALDTETENRDADAIEILRSRFKDVAEDLSRDTTRFSESDEWRSELDRVESLSRNLGAEVTEARDRIRERIEELEYEEQNPVPSDYSPGTLKQRSEQASDNDLQLMFSSLIRT